MDITANVQSIDTEIVNKRIQRDKHILKEASACLRMTMTRYELRTKDISETAGMHPNVLSGLRQSKPASLINTIKVARALPVDARMDLALQVLFPEISDSERLDIVRTASAGQKH
jgi:hypothetical protein